MIWQSITAMTIVDCTIIALTLFAIISLFNQRRAVTKLQLTGGVVLISVSLGILALFYLIDLFIMTLLPMITSMQYAMEAMRDLHLNWAWIINLCGIGDYSKETGF